MTLPPKKCILAVGIVVFVLGQMSNVCARPWGPADLLAVKTIQSVEVSRKGEILFNLVSSDAKSDAFKAQYYVRRRDGRVEVIGSRLQITEAHWRPDGRVIAASSPDANGILQLYIVDPRDRAIQQLTHGRTAIRNFAWSPNGKQLAAIETERSERVATPISFWFSENNDVLAANPPRRNVWLVDAATGQQRRITRGTYSYGGPETDHDPSWSPDGSHLAVVRQPTPLYADFERQEFVSLDVRTGATASLTHKPIFALPNAAPPSYSSKGDVVSVHTWDDSFVARQDVFVNNRNVSAHLDRDFWSCGNSITAWSGRTVLATAMDGPSMRLFRLGSGGKIAAITPSSGSVEAFSPGPDGSVVVAYSTPTRPAELYRVNGSGTLTQLTQVNALPAGVDVMPTRFVHWRSKDGRVLVGQLTESAARSSALLTELHGGPQCADDSSFNAPVQYFATNGYEYFRPSVRGSDGYGDWSYKAIVNEWGAGPMDDAMRGVDAVTQGRTLPHGLFLYGASYGGYLTSWTIGHTNRFKAAVAAIPVTDLLLDYTLSESPNVTRRFFGRRPARDNRVALESQSPLKYANNVRTPVMIIADMRDTRAPYPQAIEYYKVLNEQGKDVRLLAYSNGGHGPSDPLGILDWSLHIAGWFSAHGGPRLPGELRP